MVRAWVACVGLLVIVAGCLGDDGAGEVDGGDTGQDPVAQPTFGNASDAPSGRPAAEEAGVPILRAACDQGCWEPTVALLPDDTIVMTSGEGGLLRWRSGESLERLAQPPLPADAPTGAGFGDEQVDTSPDGRLFWSTLVFSGAALSGIQVAISSDAGGTWSENVYVSLPEPGEVAHIDPTARGADRQWLTFSPDGAVHLTFQRPGAVVVPGTGFGIFTSELMLAVAPAGGLDFGPVRPLSPATSRVMSTIINGHGVVTSDGVHLSPFWSNPPATDGPAAPALLVARTPDGGQTVTHHIVTQESGDLGYWFSVLRQTPDGRFHVAFRTAEGAVKVASSDDGIAWGEGAVWSGEDDVVQSPWLAVAPDGQLVLAYHAETDNGTRFELVVGEPDNGGPGARLTLRTGIEGQFGRPSNTDMAYLVASATQVAAVSSSTADGEAQIALLRWP